MATAADRSTIAKIATNARWARETDRTLATAPARANGPGRIEYWMAKVDPDGQMTYPNRVKAAENAKAEFYGRRMREARAAKKAKRAR